MRDISEEFYQALKTRPSIAKIVLDGFDTIQGDPIQEIVFNAGSNSDSDAISIGAVVAASVEISLDKTLIDVPLSGRSMEVYLGMILSDEEEWIPMGTYTVTDAKDDEGTLTATGLDKIGDGFDSVYEELDGIDFAGEAGVSALTLASGICSRHGVVFDSTGLQDHILRDFSPEGLSDRVLIGYIAALYGRFAIIDHVGIMKLRWYSNVDVTVNGDNYYQDGITKSGFNFKVQWLKCYNETLEETLTVGNPEADQGIYFTCPWMTQEILESLWEQFDGFTYAPVSELAFFGDPRLEPGDTFRLVTLDGEVFRVPIMSITHEFDGGLKTTVSAVGQVKSNAFEGPVQREIKRVESKILKKAQGIEISVTGLQNEISRIELQADNLEARVESTEGEISSLQLLGEELKASAEDTAGSIAQLEIRSDELATEVSGLTEEVSQIRQGANHVSVSVTDENGKLETVIDSESWNARYTNNEGKITSSLDFDFSLGQFVFSGTGKFMSEDGNSYVAVDGNTFKLFSKNNVGNFVPIAQIGYSEDSNDADFPFILLGSGEGLGLVKAFANGIYIGNSAPMLSTGSFVGLAGAAGFFVDTLNNVAYNVIGTELYDAFTAVFG